MLPPDRVIDILLGVPLELKVTILSESRRRSEFRSFNNKGFDTIFYEDFKEESNGKLSSEFLVVYDKAISEILNDSRTFLIAERVKNIHYWNSLFNLIPNIEKTIFNFLYYHQKYDFDEILFQATPHNLLNWVLAKTAEASGIKVKMIQTSPLPWRYWIVEGLDSQKPIFPKFTNLSNVDYNHLNKYFELNENDYNSALPEYEKKRLDSRNGKYWSWKKEIRDIFIQPKKIISFKRKLSAYTLYNSIAKYPDYKNNSVVLFLHYQPERTSLPEAYHYSNQWLIIKKVASCLPKGVVLYVKEHPSVFINNFDPRYRNEIFYKDISKLENVQLIPLDVDTFELIDNSSGIITITGTVGVQALIRQKLVLVFGTASIRGMKNVYSANLETDFKSFFDQIQSSKEFNSFELKKSFEERMMSSVSGLFESNINQLNFYSHNNRVQGHLSLLSLFLND